MIYKKLQNTKPQSGLRTWTVAKHFRNVAYTSKLKVKVMKTLKKLSEKLLHRETFWSYFFGAPTFLALTRRLIFLSCYSALAFHSASWGPELIMSKRVW